MKKTFTTDERFMLRCLQLAEKGRSTVAPNPMVGSVIVYNNRIIGEGWHQKAGQAHAEVLAINSVQNKALLKKSTLYVNLEPCNHFGRTPPCAMLLVKMKVKRVVVGCLDSFEKVNGSGIETLRSAGIEVTVGVLEKMSQQLNARFFVYHQKKRPYILLKWAQTKDGFIAPLSKQNEKKVPFFISKKADQRWVHQWRQEEAAILVGAQTALDDNPKLTTRWVKGKNPLRVLVDPNHRVGKEHHLFNNEANTMHYTFASLNLTMSCSPKNYINTVLLDLYNKEINSLIVEGGRYTLQKFIDLNLWDEARIYISEKSLNSGIEAPKLPGTQFEKATFGWQHQ